jgi:alpha-mannosidase
MVYEDAEALYSEVTKDGEAILEDAFCVLFPGSIPVQPSMRSKSLGGSSKIIAFNTTFFPRWDIIRIPSLGKAGPGLKNLVLQASEDGKEGYAIMHCAGGGSVGELKHPSSGLHQLIKPVSGKIPLWSFFKNTGLRYYSVYKRVGPFRS